MPISELIKAKQKKIGIKQSTRALLEGHVEKVFIAKNADQHVTRRIINLATEKNVEIIYVSTMYELGSACKIDVGAATAVIIKE
ncbi:MAG: ribosomal L7Ae/L30e/S12e/Gadd45 family protein [Clostridiales bacterium]|nr:ribosomal L7Ae/L30e/S12e/Gadd45 family protein [Clostridiales bacterium]